MADYKLFQSTLPWRERRDYLQGNPRGYNISIHAPAEGATRNPDAVFLRLTYFNPRSRGGNDESNLQSSFVLNYFNPRSRGGSDIAVRFTCTSISGFQSTLPRRERQIDHAERQYIERFQSTLPRRERRQLVAGRAVGGHISIHAPAEGATYETGITYSDLSHFNPRSRGGSDIGSFYENGINNNFNPRSRGGSDFLAQKKHPPQKISIHAPAEGATWQEQPLRQEQRNFNPRSRGGSDSTVASVLGSGNLFQSTLPRRERLCVWFLVIPVHIFQSTLPRRERRARDLERNSDVIFQSTLPRRERPRISFTFVFKRRDFNPRSRGGSDQPRRSIQSSLSKFQSTLPRRERLYSRAEMGGSGSISIHAPAEGATTGR